MRINCRIFLPFLLFYCFKGSSAQLVFDVVTYTAKSVEELECRFTSLVVQWTEQLDDGRSIVLFSYVVTSVVPQKHTNDSKYDNFSYSIKGANQFNLLITNIDRHDGGRYQCIPFSAYPVTFDITVEVLPESITINCTDLHGCMPSAAKEADQHAPQTVCICKATGVGSEMVEIEWKGYSTRNTTRDIDLTTGTFSISSETTFPPSEDTSSVSCSLTGYKSRIPEGLRSLTYEFSPPECTLSMQECSSDGTSASLICNCSDGSSELNAYTIYNSTKFAIGTQFSNKNLIVHVEPNRTETFYCSGCNGVMHSRIVKHELRCLQQVPILWILIIVILIFIIVVAVIVIVFSLKKKHMKVGTCCSGSGNKGLPLSSNIPPQRNKETKDDKDEEYENVSIQELNKVEHHGKQYYAIGIGGDSQETNQAYYARSIPVNNQTCDVSAVTQSEDEIYYGNVE